MVKCYWAIKGNAAQYNKQARHKVVSKCKNEATWHDTYCTQHHNEGWGSCTCHPINSPV
jgi:hypothetical protein